MLLFGEAFFAVARPVQRIYTQFGILPDLCDSNCSSVKPKFGVHTYVHSGNQNTQHSIKIVASGHASCTQGNKNFIAIDGFNILR
jgi:hypothetical protein